MKALRLLFLLCSLIVACKSQKAVLKDPGDRGTIPGQKISVKDSAVIVIYRGGCYGTCPVYTMSIYSNGKAIFKGQHFVTKTGIYEKNLGVDVVNGLINNFEQADVWHMKTSYPSIASDLPDTNVKFNHNGKSIAIRGIFNAPQSLQDIVKTLYAIGDSDGWQKVDR